MHVSVFLFTKQTPASFLTAAVFKKHRFFLVFFKGKYDLSFESEEVLLNRPISGILLNDSPNYRTQRITVHRMLKDFGFGRQGIEEHVKHEGDYMMDYLRANQADQDLDLMGILNVCVLNVLWRIVADKRYYTILLY